MYYNQSFLENLYTSTLLDTNIKLREKIMIQMFSRFMYTRVVWELHYHKGESRHSQHILSPL